jgi:hypothetical protein
MSLFDLAAHRAQQHSHAAVYQLANGSPICVLCALNCLVGDGVLAGRKRHTVRWAARPAILSAALPPCALLASRPDPKRRARPARRELCDVLQSCPGLLEEFSKHAELLVAGLVQAALGADDAGLLEVLLELAGLMMRGGDACVAEAFMHHGWRRADAGARRCARAAAAAAPGGAGGADQAAGAPQLCSRVTTRRWEGLS